MGEFFTYFLQILLLILFPPLCLGGVIYLCRLAFFSLVGHDAGSKVAFLIYAVTTPMREFAHLVTCVICWHRVNDFKLLNIYDPEGEIGFVEHSYNRRNPLALLGNFLFAMAPTALGLFLTFVIVLTCFHGAFGEFSAELSALTQQHAGWGEYASLTFGFLPILLVDAASGIAFKIIGAVLLLFIALGVYVSFKELSESVSGIFLFGILTFLFSAITKIFCSDSTCSAIISELRSFSATMTALFSVLLVFAAVAVVIGFFVFIYRSFLCKEHHLEEEEEQT